MRNSNVGSFMLSGFLLIACTEENTPLGGADPKPGSEAAVGSVKDGEVVAPLGVGALAKAAAVGNDVGVLRGDADAGCPSYSTETLHIRMDDEDSDNNSHVDPYGWDLGFGRYNAKVRFVSDAGDKKRLYPDNYWDKFLGEVYGMRVISAYERGNTHFEICRIPGHHFDNARKRGDETNDYAVFRLGSTCPAGGIPFTVHEDNEDNNNANDYSGNIDPSSVFRWGNDKGYSRLQFCFFPAAPATGSGRDYLPWLRFGDGGYPYEESQYGVFARASTGSHTSVYKYSWGIITVDDENNNCTTRLELPPEAVPYEARIRKIIDPDKSKSRTVYRVGVAYAKPLVIF